MADFPGSLESNLTELSRAGKVDESRKLMHHALEHTIRRSNIPLGKRPGIYSTVLKLFQEGKITEASTAAVEAGLGQALEEQADLLNSSRGLDLRRQILNMSTVSTKDMVLHDPIAWSSLETQKIAGDANVKLIREAFEKSTLGGKHGVFQVKGGWEAAFDMGKGIGIQKSQHLYLNANVSGGSFRFDMILPSTEGFSAQASVGFTGKFQPSQSVYENFSGYITNAVRKGHSWEVLPEHITNVVGAQIDLAKQYIETMDTMAKQGKLNISVLRDLQRQYYGEFQSLFQEAGPASILGMRDKEAFGRNLGRFSQGRIDRANLITKHAVKLALGRRDLGLDPLAGDTYKIMEAAGFVPIAPSSTGVSKGIGFREDVGNVFGPGIGRVSAYKEPLKAIKETFPLPGNEVNIPGTTIPRLKQHTIHALGSADKFEFQQYQVSFFEPKNKVQVPGTSTSLEARAIVGDGSMLARQRLYEEGAMGTGHFRTHRITAKALAGDTTEVGRTVAGFLEYLKTGDPGSWNAITGRPVEEIGLLTGGELMGVEAATAEQVRASSSPFMKERIVSITKGATPEEIAINTMLEVTGMGEGTKGEQVVRGYSRLIGGREGMIKGVAAPASEEGFLKFAEQAVPGMDMLSRAWDADILLPMEGFNIETAKYVTAGGLVSAAGRVQPDAVAYDVFKRIANMTNEEVANEAIKMSGYESFGGKMISYVNQQVNDKQVFDQFMRAEGGSALGLYTKWGQSFKNAAIPAAELSKFSDDLTKLVQSGVLPENTATILRESTEPLLATIGARPAAYGEMVGQGAKGTIEPRLFDLSHASGLSSTYDELLSRTTNFARPVAELHKTLAGVEGKLGVGGVNEITLAAAMESPELWGAKEAVSIDLGERVGKITGVQKIYVPGAETGAVADDAMKLMGEYIPGAGKPRPKALREVYQNFLDDVSRAKDIDEKGVLEAMEKFKADIKRAYVTMYRGVPGGTHGALRNIVEGSLFLPNLPIAQMALDTSEQTVKQFKELEAIFAQNNNKFGWGDVEVLSKKATEKMFGDAMESAKKAGDNTLAEIYEIQKNALLAGNTEVAIPEGLGGTGKAGPILGTVARHPDIGIKSMSPAILITDFSGASSELEHYVRGFETYVNDAQLTIGGVKQPRPIDMKQGLSQALNYDFDGDNKVLAAIGRHDSQVELTNMLKGGQLSTQSHAMRYLAMKEAAKANFKSAGSALQESLGNIASDFLKDAQAMGGPKDIVPHVSNIYSEMKYAISKSSLTTETKADLWRVFEAAEQVPISTKHIREAPAYAAQFTHTSRGLLGAVDTTSANRNRAIGQFFNELFGESTTSLIAEATINGEAVRHDIDIKQLQGSLSTAMEEYAGNKDVRKFYDVFRRTIQEDGVVSFVGARDAAVTSEEMLRLLTEQGGLSKDSQYIKQFIQSNAKSVQKTVSAGLVEDTVQAGKAAAKALPTKGIVGLATMIAVGVTAASISAIALGPSFSGGSGGEGRTIEDFATMQDDLVTRDKFLHGNPIPTPTTYLSPGTLQTTVNLSSGQYNIGSLSNMAGILGASTPYAPRMEIHDLRGRIDKHLLSRIKEEII